jgi:hypothetical protein
MQKVTLLILVLTTLSLSCRKQDISNNCNSLRDGIAANDISKVKAAVTDFIAGLQRSDYNESNINTLCGRISSSCDVTVELACFDCIYTLPSQSEIIISIHSGGALKTKTIDLSYTPANKIVFRNMHD